MGGEWFTTKAFGGDAEEAFRKARRRATEQKGDAPYSGTISEKDDFVVIPVEECRGQDRERYATQLDRERDERISSVMHPAGAISLKGTKSAREFREANNKKGDHGTVWLFFGVALF